MDDVIYLADGTRVRMGQIAPSVMRFASVPKWADANPPLPESQWEEHDDYAPYQTPIKYQQHNNCTNASLAGLAETTFKAAGIDTGALSMSYIYSLTNGGQDSGAMCRDVAWQWLQGGLAPESLAPESQIHPPRGGWPKVTVEAAAKNKPLEIYQCMNWADIGSAATRRFTIYFGILLGFSFFNTPKNGKVAEYDGAYGGSRNEGGHAMWGRGLTKKFGDWRLIVPNSWSKSFGDNGVCYIPASFFWAERGNFINLDAYAVRSIRRNDDLPDLV